MSNDFCPIIMPFMYFSCFIELAMISRAVVKRGSFYLVPALRGKAFILSPLSTIEAADLSWMPFIRLRKQSSMRNLLKVFIMNGR